MHLSDHSLRQFDEAYLASLDAAALRDLSVRLLADLKEARERLNQTPDTSSRPPSSRAPWERAERRGEADEPEADGSEVPESIPGQAPADESHPSPEAAAPSDAPGPTVQPARRKPGKQPGAAGRGRTQVFQAHETRAHYPSHCAGCAHALDEGVSASAYTGFQALDVQWGDKQRAGLTVRVVDHRYYEVVCGCGHHTRAVAGSGDVDPLFNAIELTEWRVVGAGLAALIVALSRKAGPLRFRLSRARIREFLIDWLGIEFSTGTIHRTLHEAAAALAPAEDERVQAVLDSDLLHADETPWPQRQQTLWLWVFSAATVTLYYIAGRGKELLDNVLDGFTGWLMSDGWTAYRHYPKRLHAQRHSGRASCARANRTTSVACVAGRICCARPAA